MVAWQEIFIIYYLRNTRLASMLAEKKKKRGKEDDDEVKRDE